MPLILKRVLLIILSVILLAVITAGCFLFWFSRNYKKVLAERIPAAMLSGTDSIYHISYTDIDISLSEHTIILTGLRLWPDTMQVRAMRTNRRKVPPTLFTVYAPRLEAADISWSALLRSKTFTCKNVTANDLEWQLACTPHPEDSMFTRGQKGKPFISHINAEHITLTRPKVTYLFRGPRNAFSLNLKGGSVVADNWNFYTDESMDTCTFLFAKKGKIRPDSVVFLKPSGRYSTLKPTLDFQVSKGIVSLQNIHIKEMLNRDPQNKNIQEVYNIDLPEIAVSGFNWNKLVNHNELGITNAAVKQPVINLKYIRQYAAATNKMGSYPHQLLLQVGMDLNIRKVALQNGNMEYVEVTDKGEEGLIKFTGINGSLDHITNMPGIIRTHHNCIIKLKGKYLDKSPLDATFHLDLTDNSGRFKMQGNVQDLDGDDVLKQAQAFTFVGVTSFHLNRLDMDIDGDETYAKGRFTCRYKDLKLSLFKFKSKHRKGSKGPFSFLGSTLILYPSNPMPGKEVREVTTTFARDTSKGFINGIWKNIYYGAQKTAVRSQNLLTIAGERETEKGEQPKQPFLKRLFRKKK